MRIWCLVSFGLRSSMFFSARCLGDPDRDVLIFEKFQTTPHIVQSSPIQGRGCRKLPPLFQINERTNPLSNWHYRSNGARALAGVKFVLFDEYIIWRCYKFYWNLLLLYYFKWFFLFLDGNDFISTNTGERKMWVLILFFLIAYTYIRYLHKECAFNLTN